MSQFFNLQGIRLTLLITFHYLKRNIFGVAISLLILSTLVFLQINYNLFYANNILTEGFIGTFQEHDIPLEVKKLISQGLVVSDENGRIKPNLVSGWSENSDHTEFDFKLKDNLRWSDGTVIKSSELEFSIPDATVSYPDDKTIHFKLKEAYSPFPSLLTKPILKKGTLMGIGPYSIFKIEKSRIFISKITLKSLQKDLPLIYIRFYPSEKVALTGFSLGEVAALFGVSSDKVIVGNPQVKYKQKTNFTEIVTIAFNLKDPLLSNRSMRQALGFITPEISNEQKADSPYPPFYWAYNPDSKKYLADKKDADAALNRAKQNLPADMLKSELILTSTPTLETVGNSIITQWKTLGLDAKLRVESGIPQNFQSLLITQSIPLDPDQYFLWHSSQEKTNLSKYSSVRIDKDLEDGRKIIKEEERKQKYFDFQKTLLEDAPAIFLYFPKYNIAYLKKSERLLDKVIKLQI